SFVLAQRIIVAFQLIELAVGLLGSVSIATHAKSVPGAASFARILKLNEVRRVPGENLAIDGYKGIPGSVEIPPWVGEGNQVPCSRAPTEQAGFQQRIAATVRRCLKPYPVALRVQGERPPAVAGRVGIASLNQACNVAGPCAAAPIRL